MSIEKVPQYTKPFTSTPLLEAMYRKNVARLRKLSATRGTSYCPTGSAWMTDADIGNTNPTLDWRLALLDGSSAADAPHGYSAFWGS